MIRLTGVSWDHPRGLDPLVASAAAYRELDSSVEISWTARSLLGFGEDSLAQLAERNDLVILDHPFIGEAAEHELVLPFDDLLDATALADFASSSVGPSWPSYEWQGRYWALPVDASAQIASWRPDVLGELGLWPPTTWDGVIELAGELTDTSIGLSLIHTDLVPMFLTMAASLGSPVTLEPGQPVVPGDVLDVTLGTMKALRDLAHPMSLTTNPIGIYEAMTTSADIAFCPLGFAFSNYSRPGFRPHTLTVGAAPGFGDRPARATLGGAGIAISARCADPEAAVRYCAFVAGAAFQVDGYVEAGGQPAHRAAWLAPGSNEMSSGFFLDALPTVDAAYLRPRFDGYLAFQDGIGPALHAYLSGLADRDSIERTVRASAEAAWRFAECPPP